MNIRRSRKNQRTSPRSLAKFAPLTDPQNGSDELRPRALSSQHKSSTDKAQARRRCFDEAGHICQVMCVAGGLE